MNPFYRNLSLTLIITSSFCISAAESAGTFDDTSSTIIPKVVCTETYLPTFNPGSQNEVPPGVQVECTLKDLGPVSGVRVDAGGEFTECWVQTIFYKATNIIEAINVSSSLSIICKNKDGTKEMSGSAGLSITGISNPQARLFSSVYAGGYATVTDQCFGAGGWLARVWFLTSRYVKN